MVYVIICDKVKANQRRQNYVRKCIHYHLLVYVAFMFRIDVKVLTV